MESVVQEVKTLIKEVAEKYFKASSLVDTELWRLD